VGFRFLALNHSCFCFSLGFLLWWFIINQKGRRVYLAGVDRLGIEDIAKQGSQGTEQIPRVPVPLCFFQILAQGTGVYYSLIDE